MVSCHNIFSLLQEPQNGTGSVFNPTKAVAQSYSDWTTGWLVSISGFASKQGHMFRFPAAIIASPSPNLFLSNKQAHGRSCLLKYSGWGRVTHQSFPSSVCVELCLHSSIHFYGVWLGEDRPFAFIHLSVISRHTNMATQRKTDLH
jgi:hypothetical protein